MYMCDLYNVLWDDKGELKPKKPPPTPSQRTDMQKKALDTLMDTLPSKFFRGYLKKIPREVLIC